MLMGADVAVDLPGAGQVACSHALPLGAHYELLKAIPPQLRPLHALLHPCPPHLARLAMPGVGRGAAKREKGKNANPAIYFNAMVFMAFWHHLRCCFSELGLFYMHR